MNLQIIIVLIAYTLFAVLSTSPDVSSQPTAKCQTGFFYQTLPLIADEAYITNLDHLFNGYNLEYKLEDHEDFKDYITLGDKIVMQGKEIPDTPLIGLKNYHIDKRGNGWGATFIALTERSDKNFVHYGVLNSNKSAPVVNNMISIENATNTTSNICFDAVQFKQQDLILVDCVVKLPKPNARGQILQNVFYYFRISDAKYLMSKKTEMYINFRDIKRRSLLLYSDLMNEHTFLLRTYFYDGMDKAMSQNTYIEVFMISEPNDPWIVEIIDRAFLNTKALSISDVKIYLGEIFILDLKMGLYRVFINTEEDLKLNGYYEVKGFERFSVYSSNLEDNFELALVNSHTALQLDWTNKNDPRLINKYSLMPDSQVSQIFLNDRFVFIQSSSTAQNTTYNYTWIMNRGDRTYTKAFKTIRHASSKTIIDLNQDMSYLIVIDDEKLANYAIDDTNMVIKLKKVPELLNKINNFKITAMSKDDMAPKFNKTCQIQINFTLLEDNNKTMWPIGELPPSQFTANYPGKVEIRLHEYVFGPNITYKLRQADHDVVKKLKVYQQQPLKILWQVQPPIPANISIKFLLSQTINYQYLAYDSMHLYLQDDSNITYFIQCFPDHFKQNVTCNFTHQEQFQGQVNSWVSGFFLNRYTQEQNHLIAYTTKQQTNKVRILDFTQKEQLQDVLLEKGFAGNATSIAITNKELYVVLKYVKNIKIYDLELCLDGICQPKCQLNHLKMYQLGIKYFSPMQVHTSVYHPNIIFIKTSDQIIVVDYNAECKPKLLAKFSPVVTAQTDFHFKLNEKFLIVTMGSLNLINEYNIQRIALGQIRLTKQYPRYNYNLPKVVDIDVSDKGNCIYVTMDSEDGDHQVFVYRSGFPAVGTLYDVIDLTSTEDVLVDSTGYEIDYVSVYANKQLQIFRQYQEPLAQVFNPNISYSFYVEYSNPISHSNLQQINVKIINLPTYITVNPWLNDIMNTKDLLYSGYYRVNQINDSAWWQGNVVVVQGDCDSCRGDDPIIKVMNHIQHQQQVKLVPAMSEYEWTQNGGSIQAMNSVINMLPNGTISQYVKLPFIQNSLCITQAISNRMDYHVSGCLSDNSINLYLTSFVSTKGFAFEPFETSARNLFKLQAVNDLIILVDTDSDPYRKTRPGGVFLYGVNIDDQIPTSIVQVEYIDGDDIGMDEFGDLYINNAELTYHPATQSYRLYLTEMTRGIFTIEFKYNDKSNTIVIKAINYLKIEPLLTKLGYQLPYDASYQAITKMSSTYDQTLKKINQKMLLTTGKFHTIQLSIDFSIEGPLQQIKITRLYQRYSFYNIQNYIKYHNNLFVISQILPDQFDIQNRSKQLLTTYSTSDNRSFTDDRGDDYIDDDDVEENVTVEERGFLGGFRVDDTVMHYYDFNLTYSTDGHTEPRVGMVLIEYLSNKLQKFTLHQNLSVVTKEQVDTQIIYLDLKNDFSIEKIRILINGRSPFPQWKLITIILFSIIGGILLIGAMAFGFMKLKNKYLGRGNSNEDMLQDSLLTGSDRNSFKPLTLNESQESKQSKKDEKKRLKQEQKERKRREKEEKQREKQRQRQEKQRQKAERQAQKQAQRQAQRSSQRQRQAERQRERQSQRQNQRQKQSERQRQRQREGQSVRERENTRERERQRQRERERQRQRESTYSTTTRTQTRPTFSNNNYNDNGYGEEDDFAARFAQRRAFRDRPDRPTRNNNDDGPSNRPPPPSRRRNNAIIED